MNAEGAEGDAENAEWKKGLGIGSVFTVTLCSLRDGGGKTLPPRTPFLFLH